MNRRGLVIGVLGTGLALSALARFWLYGGAPAEASPELPVGDYQPYTLDHAALSSLAPPPTKRNGSQPALATKAAYLVDTDSGYPLYSLNERESVPIASTTKLMTASVVVESYQLSDIVEVSQAAAATIGSEIQLATGERITVESLLKALLIQSGNDAALALAEHMGLEKFVQAMNTKAAELGLTGTHFNDPAGLDDSGRSTARDLAVIAAYALRHPAIAGIVRLPEATVTSVDGKFEHKVKNSNRLIQPDSPLYLPQATGLKTGYTPDASHCLVASATQDGHTVVSVILGTVEQTAEASAKESRKLLTWGFENFEWK